MKTCPICAAKAFDDAEVCYGCLYRYGSEAGTADATRAQPAGRSAAMPAAMVSSAAEAPQVRSAPDKPERASAEDAAGEACVAALPLDSAGWTVRFELPGFVPVSCSGEAQEGITRTHPGIPAGGCSLHRDHRAAKDAPCGLIVRFQPDVAQSGEERRRRLSHGSHARASLIDTRILAPLPEGA